MSHIEEIDSPASSAPSQDDSLSVMLIHLLKGVVYRESDERLWSGLIKLQTKVRDFVTTLGLELTLDESEGYAFLRSQIDTAEEEDSVKQPRLMVRRQLSFQLSLLIALLRKRLVEFDARGGETRLILSRGEIIDMIKVFLPEGSNETKIVKQIDAQISKVIDMGFLKELKNSASTTEKSFEVRRILKAFVDAQWLSSFDEKLAQYQEKAKSLAGADDND